LLFGAIAPNPLRILSFLQFLALAIVISAVGARQSRALRLVRTAEARR
jgi:hypothetical protein